MRLYRLLFIARHCPPLAAEAYKAAIAILKRSSDVPRYKEAVNAFAQVSPNDPDAKIDDAWVERTSKEVKMATEKLEAELKSYKNNMIKESIRVMSTIATRHP